MWQLILITISAVAFFGFVILGVYKFGLLSCYSAYGVKWRDAYPMNNMNVWSLVTIITALILIPPLVEFRVNTYLQFTGFLAPLSLTLVAFTPDYATDKKQNVVHQIGAWSAVVLSVIYVCFNPKFLWIIGVYLVIALILSFIWPRKKNTITFWSEMAVYGFIYTVLIILSYVSIFIEGNLGV